MKKYMSLFLAIVLIISLTGCSIFNKAEDLTTTAQSTINSSEPVIESVSDTEAPVVIDYNDAASFEKALNDGVNVRGKTVKFVASKIFPDSVAGFNITAGNHLNFISEKNPGINEGQIVTVRISKYSSELGSWFLNYEVLAFCDVVEIYERPAADSKETTTASTTEATTETTTETTETTSEVTTTNIESQSTGNHAESTTSVSSVTSAADSSEKQSIKLIDSGYTIASTGNDTTVYYAVVIENPNKAYAVEFPEISIVCKAANGKVLDSETQTLNYISAGDTITYANLLLCESSKPSTVDISISADDYNYEAQDSNKYVSSNMLTFLNVTTSETRPDITFELKNKAPITIDSVAVSAVYFKNGKIIGGCTDYIDNIASGETKHGKVSGSGFIKDFDKVQLFGCVWE